MSQLIAVYGSPNAGKTTFALKLGQEIYARKKSTCLFISPDLKTPTLPILFPRRKNADLFSVGAALAVPEITENNVLSSIVTNGSMMNFGYLGYKAGENLYTYPSVTEDKIIALFSIARTLADYIIVDCTADPDDLMSVMALDSADLPIRVASPDLKSMAYFSSQMPVYLARGINTEGHMMVLNSPTGDIYTPDEAVKKHYQNIAAEFPFCRSMKQAMADGTLVNAGSDLRYHRVLKEFVAKEVLAKWQ